MKNSILHLIVILLSFSTIKSQDLFYHTPIGKVYLEEMSNAKILLKFRDDMTISQKESVLKNYDVFKLHSTTGLSGNRCITVKIEAYVPHYEMYELLDRLNEDCSIVFANPFYFSESGSQLAYTNEVMMKLYDEYDLKKMISLCNNLNLSQQNRMRYLPDVYIFELTNKSTLNTLEVSNFLYETDLFEWVQPNFVRIISR